MKKNYLFLLFILLIPITTRALDCEVKPVYHITFNTNSSENITKINVTEDINLPIPVKDNSKFIGWYYDEDLTIKADINKDTDIDNNYYVKISTTECEEYYELKLYAKWEKICDDEIITHHIIYVTNTNEKLNKISIPLDKTKEVKLKTLTREGYKFDGWYYDSNYKNKVNITTYNDINDKYYKKVSSSECNDFYEMKIYAKWTKITTSNSNNSNISSNSSENSNNIETTNILYSNSNIGVEEKEDNTNNITIYIIVISIVIASIIGFIIYKKRKK